MIEVKAKEVTFKGLKPVWTMIGDKDIFALFDIPEGYAFDKCIDRGDRKIFEVKLKKVV